MEKKTRLRKRVKLPRNYQFLLYSKDNIVSEGGEIREVNWRKLRLSEEEGKPTIDQWEWE